jgi:hypothetical protein
MVLPQHNIDPHSEALPQSPITVKSLLIGTALTVMATNAGSYSRFILHSTRFDQNHLSMAAVVPLMVIVLFLNQALKLSRGELMVIFIMPLIGATMPTYFMGKMIVNITVPHYLATPENQWETYYGGLLPTYAVVQGGEPLRWFFEGLPTGVSIPWDVWVAPVFWWSIVIAAYYGCSLCLMVILRKQWIENERIDFPLMELPLAVLEEPDGEGGFFRIPILNRRILWIGFAISFLWVAWNIIHHFNPTFPRIPWKYQSLQLGPAFPPILMRLYPIVLGFGYFIRLEILGGIWLFNFLTNVEVGLLNRFGYVDSTFDEYSSEPFSMAAQAFGALVVIVMVGFWMARGHLRDVLRKAFRDDPEVDDSDEVMSYRAAVWGLIVCAAYLVVWHYKTGMEPKYIVFFLFGVLVMYLGQTRLLAEAGLISLRTALAPNAFSAVALGTDALKGPTFVGVALSASWCNDIKTAIMPALAHTLRLFDTIQIYKRRLLWAPAIAMVVGVAATWVYTIAMGYENGAANYGGVFTGDAAQWPWDDLVKKAKDPYSTKWDMVGFMSAGAVVTALMMFARYRAPGFPLSPVGFAVGPVGPVRQVVLPIFVAWFAKTVILRIGGVDAYRAARPFFIGLILGHFMGAGLSFVVDVIWFPGQGHGIPFSDW